MTSLPDLDDDDDIYVHSATQLTAPRLPASAALRFSTKNNTRYPPRPEVHVTTDQIVMEDFECVPFPLISIAPPISGGGGGGGGG